MWLQVLKVGRVDVEAKVAAGQTKEVSAVAGMAFFEKQSNMH